MALIDQATLLGIADRAAQQYNVIQLAFSDANQEGGGWYFDRQSSAASAPDPDIEIPLGQPYEIVDKDLDVDLAVRNGTRLANIVNAMMVHFNVRNTEGIPLQAGGWDGYAIDNNIRYSWWFSKLYFAVKQRYLLAIDVFSETDDVLGTVTVPGPLVGVHFTDGINYGNGSDLNKANGSNFAASQLKVVVGDTFGNYPLNLRLGVKDINNLPKTIEVEIPGGSLANTEIEVGVATDRYLDVISASLVGDKNGTIGDIVTVRNLKERQIAL